MFDHLDDPHPFLADDDLRAAVERRGRSRKRRSTVRNLAIESGAVLLLVVAALGGYVRWQATRIDRVSIAAIPQVDRDGNVVAPNVGALDRPFTILVLGNDNAPAIDNRVETNLTDTMMLLHIDRPAGTVRVVSIPRDLWVPIEGHGTERINTASQYGIPTVIATVNRVFGVTIDHYAELHFDGFERLVDAVGGVPLTVNGAMRDATTGLDLDPGCQVLDGRRALALARSRHLETRDDLGRWVSDPSSDLGRIARQQTLGVALARRAAQHSLGGGLGGLRDLATSDPSGFTLDDHLGISDLLDLSGWVADLDPGAISVATPVVHGVTQPNGASTLELDPGAAAHATQFLLGATPTTVDPTGTAPPADVTHLPTITAPADGSCP